VDSKLTQLEHSKFEALSAHGANDGSLPQRSQRRQPSASSSMDPSPMHSPRAVGRGAPPAPISARDLKPNLS
jgi:hypothetical protein